MTHRIFDAFQKRIDNRQAISVFYYEETDMAEHILFYYRWKSIRTKVRSTKVRKRLDRQTTADNITSEMM